jgi:transglutaminase-like putative cysteine protease
VSPLHGARNGGTVSTDAGASVTAPLFQLRPIPPGDPGAQETLVAMRQLVTDAAQDPGLVQVARRVTAAESRDADDIVEAIRDVLETRVRYVEDPPYLEYLQSPDQLLGQMTARGMVRGDCDDVAILAAFLGVAHGLPYKFRAVGFSPEGALLHVYTLLRRPGGWAILDTTRVRTQPVPPAMRGLELEG